MFRKFQISVMFVLAIMCTDASVAADQWMHVFDETDFATSTADRMVIPQGLAEVSGSGELYFAFRSIGRDGYGQSVITLLSDGPWGSGWVDWAFSNPEEIHDLASGPGTDLLVLTTTRIIRVDVTGAVVWAKLHKIANPAEVTMLANGNVVIVGNDLYSGVVDVIRGIDGGRVVATHLRDMGNVACTTVTRSGANGFVVGGWYDDLGVSKQFMVRYDDENTAAWMVSYGTAYNQLHGLREESNGDILAIANTNSLAPTLVWRMSAADGSVIDQTRLDAAGSAMDVLSGGDIVIGGRAKPAGALEDGWMARLASADLSIVWEGGFGGSSYDEFKDIVVLPGDRIAAAGVSSSFGRRTPQGIVTVVNATGSLQAACPVTSTVTSLVDSGGLAPVPLSLLLDWGLLLPKSNPFPLANATVRASEVCPHLDWVEDPYEYAEECLSMGNSIRGGEMQERNFWDDLEDWTAVNLCEGRSYTIETTNLGLSADTILELHDPTCTTLLMSDDDSGAGAASRLSFIAPTDGVHHLAVREKMVSGGDRGYTLQVTGDTSTCSVWEQRMESGGSRYIQDLLQLPDGRVVGVGSTVPSKNADEEAWIFAVDQEGAESWSRVWASGTGFRFRSIAPDIGGRFQVSGELKSSGIWDAGIYEFDANGLLQSAERTVALNSFSRGIAVERTLGWVTVASDAIGNAPEMVLQRRQPTLFHSFTAPFESSGDGLFDVAVARRGTIFGAGRLGEHAALGVRLSSFPTNRVDKYSLTTETSRFVKVRALEDGTFIALGDGSSVSVPSTTDLRVIHVREDGSLIWERQFGALNENDTAVDIRSTFDGGSIVLSRNETSGRPFLTRLDPAGGTVWEASVPQDINPRSVIQTVDGGFVVAAQDVGDAVLFRLDEHGLGGAGSCSIAGQANTPALVQSISSVSPVSSTAGIVSTATVPDLSVGSILDPLGTCIDRCTDTDADGFGDLNDPSCDMPEDCDDSDPEVNPFAVERCNGVDDDCNGSVPAIEVDDDLDGFVECAAWVGDNGTDIVVGGGDCDDADSATYPDAPERNDGYDNQCPGDQGAGEVDEVSGLLMISDPLDKHLVSWPAQTWATQYEVARSESTDFSSACFTHATTGSSWTDSDIPAPGGIFNYIVRSTLPAAGSWGRDTAGLERAVTCP